jgi:hypothetical protein
MCGDILGYHKELLIDLEHQVHMLQLRMTDELKVSELMDPKSQLEEGWRTW